MGKKIIHWQSFSDSANVPSIVGNASYIDTLPFDGILVKYPDHQRVAGPLYTASYGSLMSQIGPVRQVLKKVVFNYALVQTGNSGMADPFDSWSRTESNFEIFASVCRNVGLEGIFLDLEDYNAHWFRYPGECKYGATKTLAEYREQWRGRGRQVMAAVIARWPEAQILIPHDPLFSSAKYGSPNWLGGWFFLGMFEAAPGRVISGGEHYQERDSGNFLQWYNYSLNELTQPPNSPALIPFNLTSTWKAQYNRSFGIYDGDTTGTPDMSPSVLQSTIVSAMPYCTELLWNYADYPDWLTPGKGSEGAWQDALWAARTQLGLPAPEGPQPEVPAHTHNMSDIPGLLAKLEELQTQLSGKAFISHSHPPPAWPDITGKPERFQPAPHTHPLPQSTGVNT